MRRVGSFALLALAATLGVLWAQQLPPSSPIDQRPGQRPRPGEGREPEWSAPRITEYRPRSTLNVPVHPRPRPKFPVIDIHSHQPTPYPAGDFPRLFGSKDSYQPDEYPNYWRTFETADEYFDYYRNYHAFWKLYGMNLPDGVLKKLYYRNALRLVPGLPAAGFPD